MYMSGSMFDSLEYMRFPKCCLLCSA